MAVYFGRNMLRIFIILVASHLHSAAPVFKSNAVQIMTRLSEQQEMPGMASRRQNLHSFISNLPVWNNGSDDSKPSQDLYYYKKVKNSPAAPPVFEKRPKFRPSVPASARKIQPLDLSHLSYAPRAKSRGNTNPQYMFNGDQDNMKADELDAGNFYRQKRSENSFGNLPLIEKRTRFLQDVPITPRRKTLVDVAFSAFASENRNTGPKSYIFNEDEDDTWKESDQDDNRYRKLKALGGNVDAASKSYVFSGELDSENWGKDAESAKNYRTKRSMELNRMVRPKNQLVSGDSWAREQDGVNNFYKQLRFKHDPERAGPKSYVFDGEIGGETANREEETPNTYYKKSKSSDGSNGGPKNYVFSGDPDTDSTDKRVGAGGAFMRKKRQSKLSKASEEILSNIDDMKLSQSPRDSLMDSSFDTFDSLKTPAASNNHYIFTDTDSLKPDWDMQDGDSFYREKRSKSHREHRIRAKPGANIDPVAAEHMKTASNTFNEKEEKLDNKAKFDLEASLSELMKLYNVKGNRAVEKDEGEMGSLFSKPTSQPEVRNLKDVPKDLFHSALVPGVVLRVLMTEAVLKMQYRNYNGDIDESVVEADVEFLRLARKVLVDELTSFSELKRMVGLFSDRNSLINQHTCEGNYYVLGVPWTNFSTPEENLKRWCLFESVFLDRVPYVVGADGSLMAAVAPPILQCDSSRCATVPFVDAIMFEERLHASHVHVITRCQSECRRQCKNAVGCLERCNTDCDDVRNS